MNESMNLVSREILTTDHFNYYNKYHDSFAKRVKSAKGKIMLEFFGKSKDIYLDFTKKTPEFASFIYNWDLNIADYAEMSRSFIYPILVSKVLGALRKLVSVSSDLEKEFKNEFKDAYKYELIKQITNYFDLTIRFWPVEYKVNVSTGNIENIEISIGKEYLLNNVVNMFYTVSKEGNFVTDEELLQNNIITEKDYLNAFATKQIKYKKLILENSSKPNTDPSSDPWFPSTLIIGTTLSLNSDKMSIDGIPIHEKLNFSKEQLQAITNYEFHILGYEPIYIDAMLKLNQLFG